MVFGLLKKSLARMGAFKELIKLQAEDRAFNWLPEEALKEARTKLGEGDADGALLLWRGVRTRFPERKVAFRDPIALLIRLRRLDEAESLIAEARRAYPSDPAFAAASAQIAQ